MARIKKHKETPDIDMTSFMNIMIVLVPILLLNMVVSQTTVLDIKLPAGAGGAGGAASENQQIELIVRHEQMTVNYPAGVFMRQFPKINGAYDYKGLSTFMQQLKKGVGPKKRDILILSEDSSDYQTLVSTMDALKSHTVCPMPAHNPVRASDCAEVELFPEISLGDAPGSDTGAAAAGMKVTTGATR